MYQTGGWIEMTSIYDYDQLHVYLNDALKQKAQKNPAFSLSAWSRQLGFKNSSPLSLALRGKRALPKKYLKKVAVTLDLNNKEFAYLEALAELAHARSEEELLLAQARLSKLRPEIPQNLEVIEAFKHMSNPLDAILLENIEKTNFKLDPYLIQSQLHPPYEIDVISDAIHRLIQLALIQKQGERFTKTHRNLTTENDVVDYAAREFHRASLRLAERGLDRHNVDEREYQTFVLNIRPRDLQKAKRAIRKFVNEFIEEFEAKESDFSATFLLMSQLLPLTKGSL